MLASAAVFGQSAGDFFPLQVGNQWVYQSSGRLPSEPVTATISSTTERSGRTYFVYSGMDGTQLLRVDANGALVRYDESTKTETVFIAPNGVVTPFAQPDCGQVGRVNDTNYEYRGPLGVFRGVIEVRYDPGTCRDAGLERELYLPYVGLIQRTVTTIAGPRIYDLVYARIGGVTVVSAPEVSFTAALDKSSYETLSTMRVRLALRNTGSEPLKLDFTSGQEFDISIKNERGERVLVWSADKLFIQEVHSLEVTGEKNWVATLTLTGIPAGNYTAEAYLTNSGPQRHSATVAFRITGPEPARP